MHEQQTRRVVQSGVDRPRGRETVETTTGREDGEQVQHENRFGLNECCSYLKGDFAELLPKGNTSHRLPEALLQ